MHVVMLSDAETSGGAAIAASRLAEALVQASVRVTRIVGIPDGQEHSWATRILRVRLWEKMVLKALRSISKRSAIYAQVQLISQRLHNILVELNPDIINVHNLHSAGWLPGLVEVCAHCAPTVWTLHDMWSFTGRCAYSYDCRKFLTGCDASCPTPREYPSLEPKYIARAWRFRQRFFKKHPDLVAVCPSHWLAQEAREGLWKGHRVEVIPNGLSLETYRVQERNLAREALGIKACVPVILTAAQNISERRKGGKILIEALQQLSDCPFTLVTLGHGRLPERINDIQVHSLGYIDNERIKVLVYNAADLFVHPAPVDNLPNVVMEAIACGTPVVGFAIGGIKDMVRLGQTGWLTKEVSPEALAKVIKLALADLQQGVDLRLSCRSVAEAEYGSDLQAKRYIELFMSLIGGRKVTSS